MLESNSHHPHKRRSIRLREFDYGQEGGYFITVCTHAGASILGEIVDGACILSRVGIIAKVELETTPALRSNVDLDAICVMPNHVHAIQFIHEKRSAQTAVALRSPSQTLGAIIRGWKASVTKQVRQELGHLTPKVWQRGYWEHVIRNEQDLHDIREYIRQNSIKWDQDRENSFNAVLR